MLMNERKTSYYDEYQRKKETNRSLVTPPTLLTDRGAYVNFLEVQLERVSAACLAVQSYEDRFTDMQDLIIALENRCATTTRLTSLAQQCSEEIRAESYTITNKLNQELNNEQRKSNELFESLSSRLHSAEMRLQSVTSLESRLLMLESKYHALEDSKLLAETHHMQEINQMKTRVENVLAENHQLRSEVDHTNTLLSQQIFDAKEETNKVKNLLNQTEDRFEARLAAITEDCDAKLHAMQCKHNNYIDSLNYSFAQRELELNSLHSKQYGKVGCDLTELNQLVGGEIREMKSILQSNEQSKAESEKELSELRSDVKSQQSQLFQLEEKFITRLESLLGHYRIPVNSSGSSSSGHKSRRNSSRSMFESKGATASTEGSGVADLSEIQHVSSGSEDNSEDGEGAAEAGQSRASNRSGRTSADTSVETELQALLRSILNTTTANNTALNAIAAVSAGGSNSSSSSATATPATNNKSWRQQQQKEGGSDLSALDTTHFTYPSPRSSLMRSRSLSPQRLLGSSSTAAATPAAAAVSVDSTRQRSHDSLRAMGVSPSRVMGPPPFLDAASVLKHASSSHSVGSSSRHVGTVSPQRVTSGRAGTESRSNSATSIKSSNSGGGGGGGRGKRDKKSGSSKKHKAFKHLVDDSVNEDTVTELAKSLSFSLTSPSRRHRATTPTTTASTAGSVGASLTSNTVSSLERIRQSAEHRLMSPPRLGSGTAALFGRPEQLEALRAKGIFFRSGTPQEYAAATGGRQCGGASGIELWPTHQLQPAWKPINTYVPPASYTQFDNPRGSTAAAACGCGGESETVPSSSSGGGGGRVDYTTNNIVTKVQPPSISGSSNSYHNPSAVFSHVPAVSSASVSGHSSNSSVCSDRDSCGVGSSTAAAAANTSTTSAASLINAVKASLQRSEGTQTIEGTVGGEGGSRSESRNRGVQTDTSGDSNGSVEATRNLAAALVAVEGNKSGSTTRPTRSGSNLRSAAQRLQPHTTNLDADAHAAFYRPVSPLSHSRLSKILEQYPLPPASAAASETKG